MGDGDVEIALLCAPQTWLQYGDRAPYLLCVEYRERTSQSSKCGYVGYVAYAKDKMSVTLSRKTTINVITLVSIYKSCSIR